MTTVIVVANGQLGRALQKQFPDAVALDRAALDVTDAAAVRNYRWADVDVVLNAAAWTAVDAAEDPANADAVRAANVDAVGYLQLVDGLRLEVASPRRTHTGAVPKQPEHAGPGTERVRAIVA